MPSVSADLKVGRVTADGAPVGRELQSRIACRKYECRYVSVLEWGGGRWGGGEEGGVELLFVLLGAAAVRGLLQQGLYRQVRS